MHGGFDGIFTGLLRGSAQGNEAATAILDPEIFGLTGVCQQIIAQVDEFAQ